MIGGVPELRKGIGSNHAGDARGRQILGHRRIFHPNHRGIELHIAQRFIEQSGPRLHIYRVDLIYRYELAS